MNKITMTAGLSLSERRLTLLMIGLLHAFTHIYQVALIPLYFGISKDLKLKDIDQATLLVSVMMLAYFLPSYPLGVLGDRWSRKRLLTIGLLINALGFIVLSWAPSYGWAIVAVAISGFGGSFFHPAATALTVQLFPESPGRALGQMAIGASVGFFFGPLYAGWRGQGAGWRQPTLELGLMGLVGAVLFAVLAAENRVKPSLSHKADSPRLFSGIAPAVLFVVMAIGFSCRDFAGSANATLSSLYLQRAHGDSMKSAGQALSIIFVASVISSPLFGILSDRHRLRWGMILLILSALCLAALGQLSRALFPWGLAAFGFFLMATYPVIEAAIMEAVPNEIRSRFFGLFITIAGLLGNLSHWYVGRRVDALGEAAWKPQSYSSLYLGLGLLMLVTPFSLIVVRKLPEFWKLRSPAPEFIPTR